MNYGYYKELQKKEFKKNFIFILFVLIFATVSTYFIYTNFKEERDEILKSKSLEVTYHEKNVNKVSITKVTPVSDAVGLSTTPYTFTIKNHTSKWVKYKVLLEEDSEEIEEDSCRDYLIPNTIIKVGIHEKGETSRIYSLDDIDGVIATGSIAPGTSKKYTVRIWITESNISLGTKLHYHGLLKVEED